VVSTALCYYGLAALVFVFVAFVLWKGSSFHSEYYSRSSVHALSILIGLTAISLPLKVYSIALRSLQRIDLEQAIAASFNLVRIILMLSSALLGLKLVPLAIIQGGALLGGGIVACLAAVPRFPDLRFRVSKIAGRTLRQLVKPSMGFFLLQIAGTLAFGVDNIVIAYAMTPADVTRYSVPFQALRVATGFFAVVLSALAPSVTACMRVVTVRFFLRAFSF